MNNKNSISFSSYIDYSLLYFCPKNVGSCDYFYFLAFETLKNWLSMPKRLNSSNSHQCLWKEWKYWGFRQGCLSKYDTHCHPWVFLSHHFYLSLDSLKSSISHVQHIYDFIDFLQNLNMTTKSFLGPLWIDHGVKKDVYFVNSYYLWVIHLSCNFCKVNFDCYFSFPLHNTWFEQCL